LQSKRVEDQANGGNNRKKEGGGWVHQKHIIGIKVGKTTSFLFEEKRKKR